MFLWACHWVKTISGAVLVWLNHWCEGFLCLLWAMIMIDTSYFTLHYELIHCSLSPACPAPLWFHRSPSFCSLSYTDFNKLNCSISTYRIASWFLLFIMMEFKIRFLHYFYFSPPERETASLSNNKCSYKHDAKIQKCFLLERHAEEWGQGPSFSSIYLKTPLTGYRLSLPR